MTERLGNLATITLLATAIIINCITAGYYGVRISNLESKINQIEVEREKDKADNRHLESK